VTALPHTMPDAEIRREYLQHEHSVIVSASRLNVGAYVRNVFDSMILDSVPFRTERDSYDFILRQLEGRYGRPLTPHEAGILGRVTAQEFNTRSAIAKITRTCASCDRAFRLDEQRYEASMAGEYAKVCAKCMGDTRGVPSSTIREQLREDGLGVEDLR
jgi:hypothetical protein